MRQPGLQSRDTEARAGAGTRAAFVLLCLMLAGTAHAKTITITIEETPRQTFEAFGFSISRAGNPYERGQITGSVREAMNKAMYDDLNTNVVRLWYDYRLEPFVKRYVEPGATADARAHGVEYLLLGPIPWTGGDLKKNNPDWVTGNAITNIEAHARTIAEHIKALRDEHDTVIDYTGLVNEPGSGGRPTIRKEDFARQVKILRQELDSRGLQEVKIVGLEWQPPRPIAVEYAKTIAADAEAKEAVAAIASHTYGVAITRELANLALDNGWEYVQSESGGANTGSEVAARLLSDINNAVTHWVFFIGPHTGASHHTLAAPSGGGVKLSPHYYNLKTIANAFEPGTVIRRAESSLEGDMVWRKGNRHLNAAAGVRPDGKWVVGLSNPTGSPDDRWTDFFPAENHTVTVKIPALEGSGSIPFELCKSKDAEIKDTCGDTVTFQNGEATLPIKSRETISLVATQATEPVTGGTSDGATKTTGATTGAPAQGSGACHLYSSANANQVPQGFGMPFNVLSTSRELLVLVTCSNAGAQLSVGSGNNVQYIYRLAYTWLGGGWQQVNLSGANLVGGAWYVGSAQAQLPQSAAQLSQDNFVVAYVCTWRGGRWLCGCRDQQCARGLWQLQVFRR